MTLGIDGFQKPFIKNRDSLGGGVLCWVANCIAAKRRADLETPQTEIIWLEVSANVNKFLLCVAYRPPTNGEFWFHLQNNIDNINSTNTCNILIIGDLNADFNSRQGHYLNSFAVENNLNVLIKEPTRITDT